MFNRIGALAVYVTDKERAKEFYTEILRFEIVVDLGPELCFLRSPHGAIDIYLEGGKQATATTEKSCRLSFFLHAEEPVATVFASLRDAGVRLLQDEPQAVDDATACFQLLDPDGNIIEICGPR